MFFFARLRASVDWIWAFGVCGPGIQVGFGIGNKIDCVAWYLWVDGVNPDAYRNIKLEGRCMRLFSVFSWKLECTVLESQAETGTTLKVLTFYSIHGSVD